MVTWERFHELQRHALELGNTLVETRDCLIKTNAMVLKLQERVAVLERREPQGEKPFDFGALQALRSEGKY